METFGILSLLPVAMAIVLAITLKRVILSLTIAILMAAVLVNHFQPMDTLTFAAKNLFFNEATEMNHMIILAFTTIVGAMVGLLIRAGAAKEFIYALSFVIKGKKSAQLLAWFSGILVFFDDYTNCIVVGNTMRPLTDKYKVSREKLAYIVDSTAAPITTMAIVSTWVAFQVSLIDKALKSHGSDLSAYNFFIDSIVYNSYAWFALLFVAILILSGRDFGPMLHAERRSLSIKTERDVDGIGAPVKKRMVALFAIPIFTLITVCLGDLWWSGSKGMPAGTPFFQILGNADSYMSMLKASVAALAISISLTIFTQRLLLQEIVVSMWHGVREIAPALFVLICAWALAAGIEELGTAQYVTQILQGNISAELLPTIIFLAGAIISFSTGTSFATMGILVPLALPLAFSLTSDPSLHLAVAASVLGGAVFGDHCSPISDTTILSSTGSGCGLLEHFRTQIPYALFVAIFAIIFGTLPIGYGVPPLICLASGIIAMIVGIRIFGKLPEVNQELEISASIATPNLAN